MTLDISTTITHRGAVSDVVHSYRGQGVNFNWKLRYPIYRMLPSAPLYLQALTNAYCFFSGKKGEHIVRVGWDASRFLKLLQRLWMNRCESEQIYRADDKAVTGVNLECSGDPMERTFSRPLESKHAVMFSYGKESVLTRRLLLECGIDPLLFGRGETPKGVVDPPNYLKVSSNFQIVQGRRGWWTSEYTPMIFLPMVEALGVTDLLMGNEWETGLEMMASGYIAPVSFQQTPEYEKLSSEIYSLACGRDVTVTSMIAALSETKVIELLMTRWPDDWHKYVRSCWTPPKDGLWCGQCAKCEHVNQLFLKLQLPPLFKESGKTVIDPSGCIKQDGPHAEKHRESWVRYAQLVAEGQGRIQEAGFLRIPDRALRAKVRALVTRKPIPK